MLAYLAWVDTTPITKKVHGENSMSCCQWPHVRKQTSLLNFARISRAVRRFLIWKLSQNSASGLDSQKPTAAPEKIIRLIACCIDFDNRQSIHSILIFNENSRFSQNQRYNSPSLVSFGMKIDVSKNKAIFSIL